MTQPPAEDVEEYRKTSAWNLRVHNVLQGIIVIGSIAVISLVSASTTAYPWFHWMALGTAMVVSLAAGFTGYFKYRERSFSLQQRADAIEQARLRLDEAEKRVEEEPHARLDLLSLWTVTQKRLDYYHQIATAQARKSFRNAQAAMAIGFAVVIASAVFAAWSTTLTGAIATGIIGIAGGALGGYIGRTFLKSQEVATAQLRSYFDQPLRFSRLLAAERLAEQIPESERAEVIRTLIAAVVETERPLPPTGQDKREEPDQR